MELMDTSLDKFYKQVHEKGMTIPEDILGKTAVSVSVAYDNGLDIVLVTLHCRLFSQVSTNMHKGISAVICTLVCWMWWPSG